MAPPTWKEVESNPKYKALDDTQKAVVKQRYWTNVVQKEPRFQSMDDANKKIVEQRFATAGKKSHEWSELPGNIGGSAKKLAVGIKDMVLHPIDTATNLDAMVLGAGLHLLPEKQQTYLRRNYPTSFGHSLDTASGVANAMVQRYGGLQNIKDTMITDPVGAAVDASSVLTGGAGLARAGATAAKTAGATRTANAMNTLAKGTATAGDLINPLSTTNAIGRPVRAAAGAVGIPQPSIRGASRFVNPQAAAVSDMLGNDPARLRAAQNALASPRTIVPGSKATPAQAVSHRAKPGEPEPTKFAANVKAAEDRFSDQSGAATTAREAARRDEVLKTTGYSEKALEDAGVLRAKNEAANKAAYQAVKVVDDAELHSLMGEPLTAVAFKEAARLMEQQGKPFAVSKGMVPTPNPPYWRHSYEYSGEALHAIKQAYDNLAFDPDLRKLHGISSSNVHAIRDSRNKFIEWVEDPKRNPAYGKYRRDYARDSKLVDEKLLGKKLSENVNNPTQFSATLAEPIMRNTKMGQALGHSMYPNAEALLGAKMQPLRAIEADQAREALAAKHAATGVEHGEMLTNAASNVRLPIPLRASNPSVLNSMAHLLTSRADKRIADNLGAAFQTTEGAAKELANTIKFERNIGRNEKGYAAATNALTGLSALYNDTNGLEAYSPLNEMPPQPAGSSGSDSWDDQPQIDRGAPRPRESTLPANRGGVRPVTPATPAPTTNWASNLGLLAPTGGKGTISSPAGTWRAYYNGGKGGHHGGEDIAVGVGTPVQTVRPGRVVFAGPMGNYGNIVEVDHGGGYVTRYAHLSGIGVKVGDQVGANQPIGASGGAKGARGSGNSSGPHLHFEVRYNGKPLHDKELRALMGQRNHAKNITANAKKR